MDAIIGLIGTIIGASLAGIFISIKAKQANDFDKIKYKKNILLDKYEVIYKDLNAYSQFANEISMQMMFSVDGNKQFDVKKLQTNLSDNHLIMNSMFYAPELTEIMNDVHKEQAKVVRAVASFIMDYEKSREIREKIITDAVMAAQELSNIIKIAQQQLTALVHNQINA